MTEQLHKSLWSFALKCALVFSILIGLNAWAQTNPVQTTVSTSPPYLNYLSYYGDQNNHLQITLTNLDFSLPPELVRLRIRIEGLGYELYTNPNATIGQPFLLEAGMPLTITGIDLLPYLQASNLINPSGVDLNNLPHGFTTICVDVIRQSALQQVLSSNSCGFLPIQEYQPPQTFVPTCGSVLDTNTMFHTFTWTPPMPMPIGMDLEVLYDLEIFHWDNPLNNTVLLGGYPPIMPPLLDLTTNTAQISDFDGLLELGETYVWRVKARVLSNGMEIPLIENNGYSAPCTFIYGEEPTLADVLGDGLELELFTEPSSERKGKAWWTVTDNTPNEGLSTFDAYFVEYRKQPTGNEGFEIPWFSKTLSSFEHFIYQLEPSTTYEVKVSGVIAGTIGDPTPVKTFTTPDPRVYNCGESDVPYLPTNYTPLENATVGTQVQIGQFMMTMTEVNELGGGHYAGKGEIPIAFLAGAKAKVRFDDILIDTEYLVHEGRVDVITEGLANWLDDQYQQFIDPYFVEGTIDSAYVQDSVAWVVVDGVVHEFQFDPPHYPIIVNDESGNQYTIYPDGTIVVSSYLSISETWAVTADEVIHFTQSDSELRGFDLKEHMEWFENYEVMELSDSTKYFVANKSLAKDEADKVNVEIPSGATASFELSDGTAVPSSSLQGSWIGATEHTGSSKMTLSIPARSSSGNYSIYALVNGQKVGQLNMKVYSQKDKELIVVPLVANSGISEVDIENELRSTLGEANIEVDVTLESLWIDSTGMFTASTNISMPSEVGLLSKYSDDMRDMRDAYFEQNPSAPKNKYYLFLVNGFDDPNELGYMVRGRSMGFVKVNPNNQSQVLQTISHELGHGMGALEHTFKDDVIAKGSTNNLMDYSTDPTNLTKAQWKELRDLNVVPSLFDSAEDGLYSIPNVDYICIPSNVNFLSTDVFIDLDGNTVELDNGFSPYAFSGNQTPSIAGRLAMVRDSVGNAYWPSNKSGSAGYYKLKASGLIDESTQYIPKVHTGNGDTTTLTTDALDQNKFIFKRNGLVVLSEVSSSLHCIQFGNGGAGLGVQLGLNDVVYADTSGGFPINSGLQSPITSSAYGGVLTMHGYAVKLSSLSNIRIQRELITFDLEGKSFVPLYSDYGNSRIFAGYMSQTLYDSIRATTDTLRYFDVQSSILVNSSLPSADVDSRIVYRLYEPRLGNCYEEFSFVHNGTTAYDWQDVGSRYKDEDERRTEWRGCGVEFLKQIYCESVSSGLEGFGQVVSGLLEKVEIDEKYYNPELTDYDPTFYYLFNELNPIKWSMSDQESHVQFAYLCGLANGTLSEIDGLANSLGAIADYMCDQNFRDQVNTAITNLTFDDVSAKVASDFEGNIYQKAHKTGEYTIMILTIVVPITKVNWATKISSFATTISQFSTKTVRFLDKVRSGVLVGMRTAKDGVTGLKKLIFKKSTGADVVLVNFADDGVYIIEPTVFGQVDNTYTLVYEIGEVNYKVGNNGAEELGVLTLYQKGDDVVVVQSQLSYTTDIDQFVTEISTSPLPTSIIETFMDGVYRTVTTNQEISLYRSFGAPNGYLKGGYSTTKTAATRDELAILDEWGNSLRFEAKINVPQGQTLNIGKTKGQTSSNGLQILSGGADQVLLPQNWNYPNWVDVVVDKQTGLTYTYQQFEAAFPNIISN